MPEFRDRIKEFRRVPAGELRAHPQNWRRLGRVCHAIELSPTYCALTIQRWQDYTGQQAVKL